MNIYVDNIPPKVVKDAAKEIAKPLLILANRSLQSGQFPNDEKIARITPVYKSDEKILLDNYRPISTLPVFSKVLEKLVYNRISRYLEENDLLSDYQYGFRQNRSMDLCKAFDTVSHGRLLDKLPAYGIKDTEMKWLTSYLFARAQVVNYQGTLSDRKTITHGVPQGSILGPLLFALLINDLHTEVTECKILLYADDTVVYFSHKNVSDLENILNEEVNKVAKWMSNNHLTLNLKKGKTESLLFGTAKRLSKESSPRINIKINGEFVNHTLQYKYLGVLLDQCLTFHEQICAVYRKASARLKLLKRVRHNLTTYAAKRVYLNMIQPIITYCPSVYLGLSTHLKEKLQSVQD